MAQTLTRLLVHTVFSTKNRIDLIDPQIEPELYAYVGAIARTNDSALIAAGGTANHSHLLIRASKNIALSDLIMVVKKDSSKWIKTKGVALREFQWQQGYGAFSVGQSQVPALKRYFARQKEHHRRRTFQEEFLEILRRYGVEYDERYIWT